MEERGRNRRRDGGPGWLTTLAGGALLVAVGFGLGIVAGVAYEQPGMVVGTVVGQGEEVPWSEDEAPAPAESVAELEPLGVDASELEEGPADEADAPDAREPAREVAAAPRPEPEPEPEAAPAAGGGFAVQVGAFSDSRSAERLADRLRAKGHPVYVSPGAGSGSSRWRVRVGPVPSRAAAERAAAVLKRDEKLPTWVVDDRQG